MEAITFITLQTSRVPWCLLIRVTNIPFLEITKHSAFVYASRCMASTSRQEVTPKKQQRNNMQNSIATQHLRHGNHHIYHPSDITRSLVFADSFHHNPFIFSKSPNAARSSAFCERPRLFHGKIKLRFLSKANKAQ